MLMVANTIWTYQAAAAKAMMAKLGQMAVFLAVLPKIANYFKKHYTFARFFGLIVIK